MSSPATYVRQSAPRVSRRAAVRTGLLAGVIATSAGAAEDSPREGPARLTLGGKARRTGIFNLNAKKRLTLKDFLNANADGYEADPENLLVRVYSTSNDGRPGDLIVQIPLEWVLTSSDVAVYLETDQVIMIADRPPQAKPDKRGL